MQLKKHSFIEAVTNISIGYVIAIISQIIIFPLYDIHISLTNDLLIGLWFTAVSLVRSYIIRRWFNSIGG